MPLLRDHWTQLIRSLRSRRGVSPTSPEGARAALIERKAAVQAEAAQIRRELAGNPGRAAELEARLEQLAAEERSLRLQIDRTRRDEDAPPP